MRDHKPSTSQLYTSTYITLSFYSRSHLELKTSSALSITHFLALYVLDMPLRQALSTVASGSKSMLPQPPFLHLPTEIYLEILEYLDIPSIFSLRLASRRLYGLLHPIDTSQLTQQLQLAIKAQVFRLKLCQKCMKYRPAGAFPHLVDLAPEKSSLPNGLKGLFETVRRARENRKRISKQSALMKCYGLIHPSPSPWSFGPYTGRYKQIQLRLSEGAKHIRRRLPQGGWLQKPEGEWGLFEYRGFCGWTSEGPGPLYRRWTFRCECLRCSAVASEAQHICCWCDPADSRYHLITASHEERWQVISRGATPTSDPGRILFMTKDFPYGSETSWVGRRKTSLYATRDKWEEYDLPSWNFSWCGVCGPDYNLGPKSRGLAMQFYSDIAGDNLLEGYVWSP